MRQDVRMTGDTESGSSNDTMASARDGIHRLLFAYSDGVDGGRFEEVADLFGEHGLYGEVDGPAAKGRAQVLLAMQRNVRVYEGVPRTRHVVTNVVIDL